MPLPPAPSKKATILPGSAYDSNASRSSRPPRARGKTDDAPDTERHAQARQSPTLEVATHPEPSPAPSPARGRRKASTQVSSLLSAPAVASVEAPSAAPVVAPAPTPSPAAPTSARGGKRRASPTPAPVEAITEAPAPAELATPTPRARKPRHSGPTKLFVLDTNVLMHDPMCLFRFEEHDIFLPMIVLEELDGHKKGMTEVARNARQTSRSLDALAGAQGADIGAGLKLDTTGHREAGGKLFFQTQPLDYSLPTSLPQGKADNQILGVVEALRKLHSTEGASGNSPREVVLVSKDINMRVKARALGLAAEDYQNDKTLEDGDLLYSGALALPADFWTKNGKSVESWQNGAHTYYRIAGPIVPNLLINQFVYFEAPGEPSLYARVTEIRGKTAVLQTLKDYAHAKNSIWGVTTRNREQNFAMNLLMDPEVDFVTLAGTAGTGKTLMALAAGLTQVLDDRRYTEIIMTRATVSVGEDIGFLPGTEEEKMGPWMGALDDNLEFLAKGDGGNAGEWGRAATNELIRSRIKIKSMNFMRGRTFMNKYVIIDEAQNLTPKQMKTLITRAGPGTKIVCMGNLAQIDTPYLTEGSSGLTFAVDKFKGWPHSGHITLARGERSRLADFASEVL
ncbi:PhoH family protein [Curvibacter sp. HBC61]|uniref:PhoH family protein n=1 Tax=Curvibacter cyanobacteriorum TaxID=3026422 RepID=A0ABT5MX01_9BURK|nr:PhoH family protein [Curvibacter sp. HBC61]MDD0838540.1 PhoH family protein [Curvibacter sp. HBC61]